MKKILIDARALQTYSKYRGIGRYARQTIDIFKEDKRFNFLFFEGDDIPSDIKNIVTVNYSRKFITLTDKFFLNNYLKKEKIDIYHSLAYGLPKNRKGIDYFLTVHDITPLLFPKFYSIKIKMILKAIINSSKNAKYLLADSEATKTSILNNFPKIKKDKIKVIYPMIEPTFCLSIKKPQFNIPLQYLLYTGGFDRIKNIESIIKAIKIIKVPVIFAGKIEKERKKELMKDLNDTERKLFIFTGFINDEELSYLYKNASVFLFLSLNEGFGYPPLEALKCGTISVLSERGSLKEVMGDCGVYVKEPLNIDEIVYKVKTALENSDLRKQILLKKEKLLDKYTLQNFKNKLINIYEE